MKGGNQRLGNGWSGKMAFIIHKREPVYKINRPGRRFQSVFLKKKRFWPKSEKFTLDWLPLSVKSNPVTALIRGQLVYRTKQQSRSFLR